MWLLTSALKLANTWRVLVKNKDKLAASLAASNKKEKEQEFKYATTHQSFKDMDESRTNPKSDYFTNSKLEASSSSVEEDKLLGSLTPLSGEPMWESLGIAKIQWKTQQKATTWDDIMGDSNIRKSLAYDASSSASKKYIAQFGLSKYTKTAQSIRDVDTEVDFTRNANIKWGVKRETLDMADKLAISIPFWVGSSLKSQTDKLMGKVPLDVRRKAKQITDEEGTSQNNYWTDALAFAASLPLAFGVYWAVEKWITTWVSIASNTSKVAKALNQMRLTSPKLYSFANNTLSEIAEYGVRNVTDKDFTSPTDLALGIGVWWIFSSLFWGKAVKGVYDSFSRKDVVEIEKLIPEWATTPSAVIDAIKDYKLENGFTVSEVGDALKKNGKVNMVKNKVISEDDVLMSLENWLNWSLVNSATAKQIASVINQAKKDIDNAPSWMFMSGIDDDANAIINEVVSSFSLQWKAYTTDDAKWVINSIISKYWKKYKVDDVDSSIDDLLFDIRANWNGNKIQDVSSIEDLYKLAWRKSNSDVKISTINDLRKTIESYDILASWKGNKNVKINTRKWNEFQTKLTQLAEDTGYTKSTNITTKDWKLDVEAWIKILDDIEAHSFTNSTRVRNVIKTHESTLTSKLNLKKGTRVKALSNAQSKIRLIDKDRREAISIWDEVIKAITLSDDSRLSKAQRTSVYNMMKGKLAWANSYNDVKNIIRSTVQKMEVAEGKSLKKAINKEFAESSKKVQSSASYAEYHNDVLNEIVRANEAWETTWDISHLREWLDRVKQITKDWGLKIKEFDTKRKEVVDNNYKWIVEELWESKRVEFGYEKGIFGNPEDTKWRISKTFTEADYPIRRIPELFGKTWKKVFFDNLSNAQSLYLKESNNIMDDVYKLASAFDWKWEDFKYKYNLYKLYRRKLSETLGDIDAAKAYLLDSSNMKMKDGKFFYSDNARSNLPQLSKQELERVLLDVDNLLKSDSKLIAFDKYVDDLFQKTWTRLKWLMEEEYDKPFQQVENYFPYIDKISRNTSIEEGNGIGIFTNPIALYDGFTKSVKGKNGEYALELDPFIAIESVVRNQLRYVNFKKPLSEAIRTLNKLGWVEITWSNPIDGDGIDSLFKALDLADNTKELNSTKIAPWAYRYIKQYLTDVSNGGQKSSYLDTAMSKYIYTSFLSYNTSPIISQAQSYVHMLDDGSIWDLRIAVASWPRNMDVVGEISWYALARRETLIGWPTKVLSKSIVSNVKESVVGSVVETSNKWKYDKQYTWTLGKLQLIKELGMTWMKASDWIISTHAWLQEAVRWSRENWFYTSGKFDLEDIVSKLTPEQLDNLRVSADSYMNRIMGASDAVSGKVFQSAISKWMMILWKTNANAVMNTVNNAMNKQGGERYAYLIKYFLLNSAITYWLSEIKAEVWYQTGLRSTDKQFPWFLVSWAEFLWIELDDTTRNILTSASYGIQWFIPLGGGGFTLNEIFWVGAATKDKLATAYAAWNGRLADAMSKQAYQMILGRWLANPFMQFQSQLLFWTSKTWVDDQNYVLSKLDITTDNLSNEKIQELVWLNKSIREDKAKAKEESSKINSIKDSITTNVLKEFNWVPTEDMFLSYVKSNRAEFEKAWLTNNPTWLKAFYTNLRIEKAKSEWEVLSILSSADMNYIFDKRLRSYYESGDTVWFKKEFNVLYDKWVIKSKDGFNNWMKKNILNPK
jgi:hypothetical protein